MQKLASADLSIYELKYDEAEDHLRKAVEISGEIKDQVDDRNISLLLLEALILSARGNSEDRVGSYASKALDMSEKGGFQAEKSDAHRILGKSLYPGGRFDQAETALLDGIQLAIDHDNPYREAGHVTSWAACMSSKADRQNTIDDKENWSQKAQNELQFAINQFKFLGAKYDLEKAQILLERLLTSK